MCCEGCSANISRSIPWGKVGSGYSMRGQGPRLANHGDHVCQSAKSADQETGEPKHEQRQENQSIGGKAGTGRA